LKHEVNKGKDNGHIKKGNKKKRKVNESRLTGQHKAKLITTQEQKQERQAQIELLQEWVVEVLAQEEGARTQIEQT
jgi:hypothetical protein